MKFGNDVKLTSYFYVGFEKIDKNENFIIQLSPKLNDKYSFHVAVCPGKEWLSNYSSTEYIVDKNNILDLPKNKYHPFRYINKIIYCHDNHLANKFVKCGQLNQMFLPPIDVGYDCDKYSEGVGTSDDGRISGRYLEIKSDSKIMCLRYNLLNSSRLIFSVFLSEYNYESNSNIIDIFNNKSKIYSGQRFHFKPMDFFNSEIIVDHSIGEESGYLHECDSHCTVPNINATLRLKINGIVQKHKNKIEDNFESIDTYLIDKRKIDNGLVGCHAVPDDIKLPLFEDFYEKRYQTHLLMLNEKTNEYIKVYDINSLVSNKKYKCILNVNSSIADIGILNYITESEFTIQFVDSSFII
uniref:DarT domain-containing protein n=1 Tax=Strongyloides papillosus TaxID=174720 RepID=A0A0N5B484_STREA